MELDKDGILRFIEDEKTRLSNQDGYVLIGFRTGMKSIQVYGRYSSAVVDEKKRQLEKDPETFRVVIKDARSFQERENAQSPSRRAHDDYGPINWLELPLVESLDDD